MKKVKNKNNIISDMFDVRPTDVVEQLQRGQIDSRPRVVKIKKQEKRELKEEQVLSTGNYFSKGFFDIRGNNALGKKENKRKKSNFEIFLEKKKTLPSYVEVGKKREFFHQREKDEAKKEIENNKNHFLNQKKKNTFEKKPVIDLKEKSFHLSTEKIKKVIEDLEVDKMPEIKSKEPVEQKIRIKIENKIKNKPFYFDQAEKEAGSIQKKAERGMFDNGKAELFFNNLKKEADKDVLESEREASKEKKEKEKKAERWKLAKLKALTRTRQEKKKEKKRRKINFKNILPQFKPAIGMVMMFFVVFGVFYLIRIASYGYQKKDDILTKGKEAAGHLAMAKTEMMGQDFEGASVNILDARKEFEEAESKLNEIGGNLSNIFSQVPFLSKISVGKNVIEIGQEITKAAENINNSMQALSQLENPFQENKGEGLSLGEVFVVVNDGTEKLKINIANIEEHLNKIPESEIPLEYQSKFQQIKSDFKTLSGLIEEIEENNKVFWDILGYKGMRRYLFVFQNNQEMRATGGFIGSYGVLKIDGGEVKNLFIDGIYNPDGQLTEKVVPPRPIQKISAAWSTHDANWFPNFPTSAEKIAWFYEKTGGPTVDGIIALTPTVLENLLEVTGPIEMKDYGVTVDKDNFIEKTQNEVEIDYDRELNQPKKFIADLTPIILNKVFSGKNSKDLAKTFSIISSAIKEKQIVIYSLDYNIQQIISQQGWSGEVLQTGKDYLMVVNSNINGYKTDGVVDEYIEHEASIQEDGSVIDKIKVKRVHNGGHSDYEWWNKVNCDYMRIYVPKGSRLLSVKGQTREFNQSPLDYDNLNFRRDPNVEQEEQLMEIDSETGTRIYDQDNKTVFANWVYVSPGETVEIEYEYVLPFGIDTEKNKDRTDSYSILFQKQTGSVGSQIKSTVNLSKDLNVLWKYPETIEASDSKINFSSVLSQDRFLGVALQKNN